MNEQTKIELIQLITAYTGGHPRRVFWSLTGKAKASIRAHIMAVALGKEKATQKESGINALREKLYELFEIPAGCYAERDGNLFAAIENEKAVTVCRN